MGNGASGALPSLDTGWTGLVFDTVVESDTMGVTEVPFSVAADGIGASGTGATEAGMGANGTGASAGGATEATGAVDTGVAFVVLASADGAAGVAFDDVAEVAVVDSPGAPLLMMMVFSSLGFRAPYKARPPTPAIRAVCRPFPPDFCGCC